MKPVYCVPRGIRALGTAGGQVRPLSGCSCSIIPPARILQRHKGPAHVLFAQLNTTMTNDTTTPESQLRAERVGTKRILVSVSATSRERWTWT